MSDPHTTADPLVDVLHEIRIRLDNVAGGLAQIASGHDELRAQVADAEAKREQDVEEMAGRLDALERQVLEHGSNGNGDLAALAASVDRLADEGPATIRQQLAGLRTAVDQIASAAPKGDDLPPVSSVQTARALAAAQGTPEALAQRVADLTDAVNALAWKLPELGDDLRALKDQVVGLAETGQLVTLSGDAHQRLMDHSDRALAAVVRLLDERFASLREETTESVALVPGTPLAGVGAVMGATQAAWARLEQRLDTELDDLTRQLETIAALIQDLSASSPAIAASPEIKSQAITAEQIRQAASSLKESVMNATRARWERRGGPKGLGPGGSS
jgi:hypothetical protein